MLRTLLFHGIIYSYCHLYSVIAKAWFYDRAGILRRLIGVLIFPLRVFADFTLYLASLFLCYVRPTLAITP